MIRRLAFLLVLAAAGAAGVLFYRQAALAAGVKGEISAAGRLERLERGGRLLRFDDELLRLRGRAHFQAAAERMAEPAARDAHLRAAREDLRRSLALNPLSAAAHFDLAQVQEYAAPLGLDGGGRPVGEYIAAARLGLQDPEILDACGRLLLSRWSGLDREERRLTLALLKNRLSGADEETLVSILDTWALHVGDYGILKSVLPAEAGAWRRLARFLAERGLDRGQRIEALVRAEALDFEKIRTEAAAGRSDFQARKMREAEAHFRSGRDLLDGIRFYRTAEDEPAFAADYGAQAAAILTGLLQTRLETARTIEDVLPDLLSFLDGDPGPAAVGDLDRWLKARRFIGDRIDASGKDLRRLVLELRLAFLQNRYREVTEAGQALESGVLLVPEASRADYATVLELVGDAYGKLDYLYESSAFYQKARKTVPAGPGLLYKLRRNAERLNDAEALRAVGRELETAAAAGTPEWRDLTIARGTVLDRSLGLDESRSRIRLRQAAEPDGSPRLYAAVFFNGLVVWDDYWPADGILKLDLKPRPGSNRLEIQPLNRSLTLAGLDVLGEGESGPSEGRPRVTRPGKS